MKAVRFDSYGGIEVLQVLDVPVPEPSHGEALVKVKAASINPGEAMIREGLLDAIWPATFPSGEGSDLAGIVTKVGSGVQSFKIGDEVIGAIGVSGAPGGEKDEACGHAGFDKIKDRLK
jgi:NADPH:quinone reductase-like Zn-dependent oxidoreductase